MKYKEDMDVFGVLAEVQRRGAELAAAEERFRNPPRYKIAGGKLVEDAEGEVVLYKDHAALVGRLKQEKSKAYSEGKAAAAPQHSWRL